MTQRRSHPPTLLRLAERAVAEHRLWARGERVLCACSGGPDSTALLHVLARLRARYGHELVAVGVDHGLRAEAAAELAAAADLADRHGVPFLTRRVQVAPGSGVQARARSARLAVLADEARAQGARVIATGHTADDRAETFVMRLLRGAGPRGLAVLPPLAPFPAPASDLLLARPLLDARRRDVFAHLTRHDLPFATDPTNADPRYLRARVRADVLPLLEQLAPGLVEHLCFLADRMESYPDEPAELAALGREQRVAILRAARRGRPLTVRTAQGRDVVCVPGRAPAPVVDGAPAQCRAPDLHDSSPPAPLPAQKSG